MTKEKLFTKEFIILICLQIFYTMSFSVFGVGFGSWLRSSGAGYAMLGLLTSLISVSGIFARITGGFLSDNLGEKKIMAVASFFVVLSRGLYLTLPFRTLVVLRLTDGFAQMLTGTALYSLISKTLPMSRRAEGLAYHAAAVSVSTITGSVIGNYLMDESGFVSVWFLSIICFACLNAGAIFLPKRNAVEAAKKKLNIKDALEPKVLLPTVLSLLLASAGYCITGTYLRLFAEECHITGILWIYYLVSAAANIASRPYIGRYTNKKGRLSAVAYAIAGYMICPVILFNGSIFALIISGILNGICYDTLSSALYSWAVSMVPDSRIGAATGTYTLSYSVSGAITPNILSWFSYNLGYKNIVLAAPFFMLLFAALYAVSMKENQRKHNH